MDIALSAVAVHSTCPSKSALHQLFAHTLAPLVAAAILTLPSRHFSDGGRAAQT